MRTIRLLPVVLISVLAYGGEPDVLVVPAAKAPVVDGVLEAGEWDDAVSFDLLHATKKVGRAWLKRDARQFYVAFETELNPWGLGVRFNFVDPVSKRTSLVLVAPLNPPRAPLLGFRQPLERPAEPLSCVSADLRFDLTDGCRFEMRVPMDLMEISRADKTYNFDVGMWNLVNNRTVGVYPAGEGTAVGTVKLRPGAKAATWGADTPLDAPVPPGNEGLAILEQLAGDGPEGGDSYRGYSGWEDGKRKDAPLAALEKRLLAALEVNPGFIGLHASLVQCRTVRGDLEGGLAALDALGKRFPTMAESPRHLLIRLEFLRDLGRFDEAIEMLEQYPEFLKGDERAAAERVFLDAQSKAWKLEQEMRRQDAEKGDLPRVRLTTAKGPIVLELFEDDAPNGVANFVSLVETGVYDGTRFHWAEGGRRVMGGDPASKDEDPHNDGFGDPGYAIESEPGRRLNFSYMVAFADKRHTRRTEGSTFVIHIAPFPQMDGIGTVFGRVVEGKEIVAKLEYYDEIKKAEVIRKRPHEYTPVKRP